MDESKSTISGKSSSPSPTPGDRSKISFIWGKSNTSPSPGDRGCVSLGSLNERSLRNYTSGYYGMSYDPTRSTDEEYPTTQNSVSNDDIASWKTISRKTPTPPKTKRPVSAITRRRKVVKKASGPQDKPEEKKKEEKGEEEEKPKERPATPPNGILRVGPAPAIAITPCPWGTRARDAANLAPKQEAKQAATQGPKQEATPAGKPATKPATVPAVNSEAKPATRPASKPENDAPKCKTSEEKLNKEAEKAQSLDKAPTTSDAGKKHPTASRKEKSMAKRPRSPKTKVPKEDVRDTQAKLFDKAITLCGSLGTPALPRKDEEPVPAIPATPTREEGSSHTVNTPNRSPQKMMEDQVALYLRETVYPRALAVLTRAASPAPRGEEGSIRSTASTTRSTSTAVHESDPKAIQKAKCISHIKGAKSSPSRDGLLPQTRTPSATSCSPSRDGLLPHTRTPSATSCSPSRDGLQLLFRTPSATSCSTSRDGLLPHTRTPSATSGSPSRDGLLPLSPAPSASEEAELPRAPAPKGTSRGTSPRAGSSQSMLLNQLFQSSKDEEESFSARATPTSSTSEGTNSCPGTPSGRPRRQNISRPSTHSVLSLGSSEMSFIKSPPRQASPLPGRMPSRTASPSSTLERKKSSSSSSSSTGRSPSSSSSSSNSSDASRASLSSSKSSEPQKQTKINAAPCATLSNNTGSCYPSTSGKSENRGRDPRRTAPTWRTQQEKFPSAATVTHNTSTVSKLCRHTSFDYTVRQFEQSRSNIKRPMDNIENVHGRKIEKNKQRKVLHGQTSPVRRVGTSRRMPAVEVTDSSRNLARAALIYGPKSTVAPKVKTPKNKPKTTIVKPAFSTSWDYSNPPLPLRTTESLDRTRRVVPDIMEARAAGPQMSAGNNCNKLPSKRVLPPIKAAPPTKNTVKAVYGNVLTIGGYTPRKYNILPPIVGAVPKTTASSGATQRTPVAQRRGAGRSSGVFRC